MKNKFIILGLIMAFLSSSGFGCKGGSQQATAKMQPVTINVWGVWDGQNDLQPIIDAYRKIHPNIEIKYRKFSSAEYETELLNAMAEDRGPDIITLNANSLRYYQPKLAPLPSQITMAYPQETGTIKKEIIPQLKTNKSISLSGVKNNFIDTVYDDVVFSWTNPQINQKELRVWGLPLSMDTMVMYYNRSLLNNANISQISPYWDKEFQMDVKKLTKQDTQGNIIQSGVAMGSGSNVERSSDILTLIMRQSGAQMLDNNGRTAFIDRVAGKDYNPGLDAIRFYTDFANPTKDVYSWNASLDNSLQMFINGRLAIMFGYNYHMPIIKAQAPKLNFGIAAMPQLGPNNDAKNSADYWVEAVSKKTKHLDESWDFIQFAALNSEANQAYLTANKRLSALRSFIETQKADNDLGVFAGQLLTSHTWYSGYNYGIADKTFQEMLDLIAKNSEVLTREAQVAEGKINQTLLPPKADNK